MTLDELAIQFETGSNDPVVRKLGRLLLNWKTTDATVTDLVASVEHYIGTTWIADEVEHEEVYGMWVEFRDDVINQIDGIHK